MAISAKKVPDPCIRRTGGREEHTGTAEKNTLVPERWHTEVNVGETFCVYCISSAFVYGVQAEAGELRLIKKSSLKDEEKGWVKNKFTPLVWISVSMGLCKMYSEWRVYMT